MNILFLTIGGMDDIEKPSIYTDLLRCFRDHGHQIYIVTDRQRRTGMPTELVENHGVKMLHVKIGNITKCGIIEKGISTMVIERQYRSAVRHYFSNVRFDLILYPTPPITLAGVVADIKKRDGARSYLLLKDIFPQNAVDLKMMTTVGPKSVIYRMFRRKEQKLYALSDTIGCMSEANIQFVLSHNPDISPDKVEICPNSIEIRDVSVTQEERRQIREKYGIPQDKKVFVYGGNLGRPQGIPFLIECLKKQLHNPKAFFLIVGSGTEYRRLEEFFASESPTNMKLMKRIPKEDYDRMIPACDVGMLFLDHRFTIPNFPSRLLAYMQAGLPVLACTDPNTDVGNVIEEGHFGWWCESNDAHRFSELVAQACDADLVSMAISERMYLEAHYTVQTGYGIIMNHFKK